MTEYYTTKEAAEITGASRQIIRTYTETYRRYFSAEGAPAQGMPRRFTRDDLRLIKYVHQSTALGLLRNEVSERLAAGEFANFDWEPPAISARSDYSERLAAESDESTALVPLERLQAAQALMQDAQRRESEAVAQVTALQEQVQALSLELGKAQGELSAVKGARYRAPAWVRAIFGGRESA